MMMDDITAALHAAAQQRLHLLRDEFDKGQRQLEQIERQRQETRDTLLRISGAIQVLEELLGAPQPEPAAPFSNGLNHG